VSAQYQIWFANTYSPRNFSFPSFVTLYQRVLRFLFIESRLAAFLRQNETLLTSLIALLDSSDLMVGSRLTDSQAVH
jgi:hypothetical protein